MKTQAYRVALVPFPCTMLACLGYFIYRLRGLIDEKTMVFYHWGPGRKGADKPRYEGTVALFGKDFERGLERYVRQMDPRKSRLWNTFNSTRSPVKQADFIGQQQFRKLASFCWQDPRNVLAEMERSFETKWGGHLSEPLH